ncbi:LAMI_0H05050g1_1 [Lachancea mirantina]|uniref:LAMI_0H05050g1_1 n=1 Tax=Lachancea mirantina TaxID=1230905 RepID=A0A1G4KES0_9SACH|nr:LAMI_0H05050g1_1 [Lachancea mirantina]
MSNSLLTADIAGDTIIENQPATNERSKLMWKAYNNETWSIKNLGDQKMIRTENPILYQICMVENISRSKLNLIDDLKVRIDPRTQRVDRLNSTKHGDARDYAKKKNSSEDTSLITAMDVESDMPPLEGNDGNGANKTVYKLTLQDKSGAMFYAMNLKPMSMLKNDGAACMLGAKLVILPGAFFNRGVFLLDDKTATFMGGVVKKWNDGRDNKTCEYLEARLADQVSPGVRKRRAVD